MKGLGRLGLSIWCLSVMVSSSAGALPFNQDMVGTQYGLGQIMRPKATGAVSTNDAKRFIGTREEAASLKNPVAPTGQSILHGKRIYNANCSPCHGSFVEGKHVPGPVGARLPAVNLAQDYLKVVPDSHFFQFIHFGGMAIMPAYGWKLSLTEHWDIVNYIRSVQQGETVSGKPKE
jgi:mono/diheme cytochrome c family protein